MVKSGDTTQVEARAARLYWPALFGPAFLPHTPLPPNGALNYGYAWLRAAMAQAVVGAGLLPRIGIHHHNQYNPFCLVDDLMEPYRPFVDLLVWEHPETWEEELSRESRDKIGHFFLAKSSWAGKSCPLDRALIQTAQSLAQSFSKNEPSLLTFGHLS